MVIIIITGTPGTGKSTVANYIAAKFKFIKINIKQIIRTHNLSECYDNKRKCNVVDEKKFAKAMEKEIVENKGKNILLDSHLSHYISPKKVDLCIVCNCDISVLNVRLKKRRYNKEKIRENLDCEIFDVCYNEALEFGHNVIKLNTTKGINKQELNSIISSLTKKP